LIFLNIEDKFKYVIYEQKEGLRQISSEKKPIVVYIKETVTTEDKEIKVEIKNLFKNKGNKISFKNNDQQQSTDIYFFTSK